MHVVYFPYNVYGFIVFLFSFVALRSNLKADIVKKKICEKPCHNVLSQSWETIELLK